MKTFKQKLKELCNLCIPTISIKSEFQPPWFDNETFKLCRKKERLRAKFKVTKNPIHYQSYSKCRSHLKELIHKKMRANIVDDDEDPSIISKKFWSYVKSTSNSSRIPETISYNVSSENHENTAAARAPGRISKV